MRFLIDSLHPFALYSFPLDWSSHTFPMRKIIKELSRIRLYSIGIDYFALSLFLPIGIAANVSQPWFVSIFSLTMFQPVEKITSVCPTRLDKYTLASKMILIVESSFVLWFVLLLPPAQLPLSPFALQVLSLIHIVLSLFPSLSIKHIMSKSSSILHCTILVHSMCSLSIIVNYLALVVAAISEHKVSFAFGCTLTEITDIERSIWFVHLAISWRSA